MGSVKKTIYYNEFYLLPNSYQRAQYSCKNKLFYLRFCYIFYYCHYVAVCGSWNNGSKINTFYFSIISSHQNIRTIQKFHNSSLINLCLIPTQFARKALKFKLELCMGEITTSSPINLTQKKELFHTNKTRCTLSFWVFFLFLFYISFLPLTYILNTQLNETCGFRCHWWVIVFVLVHTLFYKCSLESR